MEVYLEVSSGAILCVRDIRWVENPAVAQFEIIVDVLGENGPKGIVLKGCFEFGNSDIEVEEIVHKRDQFRREHDTSWVKANPLYLRARKEPGKGTTPFS